MKGTSVVSIVRASIGKCYAIKMIPFDLGTKKLPSDKLKPPVFSWHLGFDYKDVSGSILKMTKIKMEDDEAFTHDMKVSGT